VSPSQSVTDITAQETTPFHSGFGIDRSIGPAGMCYIGTSPHNKRFAVEQSRFVPPASQRPHALLFLGEISFNTRRLTKGWSSFLRASFRGCSDIARSFAGVFVASIARAVI
jgi:hypothetical protein